MGPENYFILQKSFNKNRHSLRASSVLLSPRSMRSMRSIRLVMTRLDPHGELSTPAIVCPQGKTTSHNVRSCDPVRQGLCFPTCSFRCHSKQCAHRRQHGGAGGILAHFIVIHPEFRCPASQQGSIAHHTPEPDNGAPGRARWRMTDRVCGQGLAPLRPLAPDRRSGRQALCTQGPRWRARISYGPRGPF